MLTRALTRDLGSYITVNAVAPSLVSNEATSQLNIEEHI
jgi:NAD(P)-dependent dehydrogenase (short-subunit alcohol dehydrogenase family)